MIHVLKHETDDQPMCDTACCPNRATIRIKAVRHGIGFGMDQCWSCASDLSTRIAMALERCDKCEHGVKTGEWCLACNLQYKDAAKEAAIGAGISTINLCRDLSDEGNRKAGRDPYPENL